MRQVYSVLHPVGPRAALQGSPSPPCSEVGVSGMTQVLDSNCLQLRDPALAIYNFYCLEETLVYRRGKLNSPCAKLLAKMGNSWPPVCKTLCSFLYITDWCISLGHFYKKVLVYWSKVCTGKKMKTQSLSCRFYISLDYVYNFFLFY